MATTRTERALHNAAVGENSKAPLSNQAHRERISLVLRVGGAAHYEMTRVPIRRLDVGDVELLRSTRLRALADAPAAFGTSLAEAEARGVEFWEAQVRGKLGDHVCATWVAVDAGEGVGMLTGVAQPDAVDVIQVWVDRKWRGSGLIEEMFEALFRWAAPGRIDIAVAKSNSRARAAYERLGFQFVRERPGLHEIEIEMTHVPERAPNGRPDSQG